MYYFFLWKRRIEDIIMYPLILLGRWIAWATPLKKEFEIFFFFPFYSVGGAEKVHAQIVQAVGNNKCLVFFTRHSRNNLFLSEFKKAGCELRDISKYTHSKWVYPLNIIYRGIISGYINRQKKRPIVFNGQCNFGYKLAPWVRKNIPQVELIHSFNTFSLIRIPFLNFYAKTIMISHQTINDYRAQYARLKVPKEHSTKIQYIQNGIVLPEKSSQKKEKEKLIILYVGRGTSEKRVHLIAQIAEKLLKRNEQVQIQFLGEVGDAIPKVLHEYCYFWGNIANQAIIKKIYDDADVLILTSSFEGFPMVVMEAMASGLAIVSTAVGDLLYHIKEENGILIHAKNEEEIIQEGVAILSQLANHRALVRMMGEINRNYAFRYFGIEDFNKRYFRLFESLQNE